MPEPTPATPLVSDLDKIRLDIAWKWFDFHAKQRTTVFNFFLLLTGVLLNAYVLALRENLTAIAMSLCVLGTFQAFVFILFDIRNRQLTCYAEHIIEKIEHSWLFFGGYSDPRINGGRDLGLFIVERNTGMREGCERRWWQSACKMKAGIYLMQVLVILLFLFALVIAGVRAEEKSRAVKEGVVKFNLALECSAGDVLSAQSRDASEPSKR